MSNGKAIIIIFTVQLIKKISLYRKFFFPGLYTRSKKKVKLDFFNYVTKSNFEKHNRC